MLVIIMYLHIHCCPVFGSYKIVAKTANTRNECSEASISLSLV